MKPQTHYPFACRGRSLGEDRSSFLSLSPRRLGSWPPEAYFFVLLVFFSDQGERVVDKILPGWKPENAYNDG